MPSSCVDPGEMSLSTQTSSHYVLEVLELLFTIQSQFTAGILLPPFSKPSAEPSLCDGALCKEESHVFLTLPFCFWLCRESPQVQRLLWSYLDGMVCCVC